MKKLLPKGQHYSELIPVYKKMLEEGLKVKEIAKKLDVNEMTLRGRLHQAGVKICGIHTPKMQLAALSFKIGLHETRKLVPDLNGRDLTNFRWILKRLLNQKRIKAKKAPLSYIEIGEKFNEDNLDKIIKYFTRA